MAKGAAKTLFIFFSLYVSSLCCSGTLVGFSYDARKNMGSLSALETIDSLEKNGAFPSRIKVSVSDYSLLGSLFNMGLSVDLYVNETPAENLPKSKASAISWLEAHHIAHLPQTNISRIVFSSHGRVKDRLHLLLPALCAIRSALKAFNLHNQVKVSIAFPLSTFERVGNEGEHYSGRITNFIRKWGFDIVIDTEIDGELSLGDGFIRLVTKKATFAADVLPYSDIPLVLDVRNSVFPSGEEVANFGEKMRASIENGTQIKGRICELFVEISPMGESEQRELNWEKEQIFPTSHRELFSSIHTTSHDTLAPPTAVFPKIPITNPVTTPVTIPSTIPAPAVVTIPSTNPVTIFPTTPVAPPFTNPITNPTPTPVLPITSPVTTPVTVPMTPPVTNPVTTYPFPPPGTNPVPTPVITPVTFPMPPPGPPFSPVVSGQSWCIAKTGAMEAAVQSALDYACGIGKADCSPILQGGLCYSPNTLREHASFAFNSYYQKNPVAMSCDFGGTAMVVNINPSSGSCIYPSSSSSSSSSVLNTNNLTAPTSVFGSQPPGVTTSSASVLLVNSWLLFPLVSLTLPFIGEELYRCVN